MRSPFLCRRRQAGEGRCPSTPAKAEPLQSRRCRSSGDVAGIGYTLYICRIYSAETDMTEATVIVRVEDALKTAFAQAAKASDRTVSQLVRDFMRDYVREQAEYDAWLHRKVAAARADIAAGDVQPAEAVEARFAARRTADSGR